jgi:hypothetical protein
MKPGVRFYMCGEYGETNWRPHYHAILFNCHFDDLVLHSEKPEATLYTSKTLDSLWQKGFAVIGAVSFESAAYVSRYCLKKVTGKNAEDHYTRLNMETGEIFKLEPEFNRMSTRPGIARPWLEKFKNDVFPFDHVIVNGHKTRPGKYYDRVRDSLDPLGLEQAKYSRYLTSKEFAHDNTPERLAARAVVARAKTQLKQRNLC